MTYRGFDFDYPIILLIALVGILVVSVIFAMSTSSGAFGPYNKAWDGSSDFRAIAREGSAETVILTNATRYASVPSTGTIAVVLSPQASYTPSQLSAVKQYVNEGGTILIAEDFGSHSNEILVALGASTRVDGRLLRDARNHHRSSALPVARNLSGHPILSDVDGITLNYGTTIVQNQGDVMGSTSEFGYLDENSNGNLDDQETLGSYPVLIRERIGSGTVILLGDPSVLINVMLDRPGNRAFAGNLVSQYDRIILDYSHVGPLPPIAIGLVIIRGSAVLQILMGGGIIGVFLLLKFSPLDWFRQDMAPTQGALIEENRQQWMINYLTRKHPDWEEERIRRIVNHVLKTPNQTQRQ